MPRKSIFHKIVQKENSYTQLLVNFLNDHQEFRTTILTLLFKELASEIGNSSIQTQKNLGDCGTPDIFIETGKLCLIVEVKVELGCPLTDNQGCVRRNSDKEFRGYMRYLTKSTKEERSLVYLIPEDWKDGAKLDSEIADAKLKSPEILVDRTNWQDVLREISKIKDCPLVEEFRLLLSHRFDLISFFDRELDMLFRTDFPIRAVWSLETLLSAVSKRAANDGYEVSGAKKYRNEEVDLYFRKGGRDVLYLGCWADFWEKEGFPLCFGVDKEIPGMKSAFEKSVGKDVREFGDYTLSWITKEDLDSNSPTDNVWARIRPVLDKLLAMPT